MKNIITLTKTMEVEIELMPSMFGQMTLDEYIKEFSQTFWKIQSVDDLVVYAASCVMNDQTYGTIEGLGTIGTDETYDVKYKINSTDFDRVK